MSDIVAQLEVLSRESGCLIDLSAIIDLSICPKIDLKTHKPHKVEEKDDYICVTPTEQPKKHKPGYKEKREVEEKREIQKRCDKGNCFEVREDVCKKNHVALDLEILIILGLLTEEDLEKYLKTTGDMNNDDKIDIEDDDVGMDPLLSLGVGDDDSVLDLEVGGDKGLINLDGLGRDGLLNIGGEGGLLNLNLRRRGGNYYGGSEGGKAADLLDVDVGGKADKNKAPIDVDVITHPKLLRRYLESRGNDRLADVDVGGKKDKDNAAIDVDVLTHPRKRQNKGLLDLNLGGYEDEDEATIDLDLLTRPRPNNGQTPANNGNGNTPVTPPVTPVTPGNGNNGNGNNGNGNNGNGNDGKGKGLLDVNVGGYEDDEDSTIDLDLLTRPRPGQNGNGNGNGNNGNGNGNNGNGNGNNGNGNGNGNNGNGNGNGVGNGNGKGNGKGNNGGYLSHYQPMCNKGFKKPHSEHAKKCHAQDVNHCLAICHSQSALLTLQADAKVGDIANILLCAAIEFNSNESGDNCRYFVAPETEPCHDEQLEENEDCTTFVRN